jgi:BirA family transcriptional regulator, biotin operon repressor / biotin---[acetyl-CoA-carboxylase] ligase
LSSSNPIGSPFIELHTVDSTNNYAMGMVHAGMAHHGITVFAKEQTRGRGQWQREWISEPEMNIAMSVIIEPKALAISELFLLSKCIATGVASMLESHTHGDVKIKWPNDIYWRDRKAGGILIENVLQGSEWKYSIVGIGLNVNQVQFPGLEGRAVSLRQITGKDYGPLALANELCIVLEQQYQTLVHNKEAIRYQYQHNLYKAGEWVKLKQGGRVFDAIIREVSDQGILVVEHSTEERFEVGEVEWIS